ncbi:Gfo/Idh/MocA family oxidoreductase [Georgenia halophila]|uniref:Gfo/Idh/MocA family oxidoreductase n=1 Tax=Georgenia halophila TaxID=620889 RepID=A0ABP8LGY7_9MICO
MQRAPVRLGILGAGGIAGGRHLPAVRELGDRAEVVAVADLDGERAHAFAETWRIPHSHDSLEGMLDAEDLELVVVCTPPGAHRDAIVACLRAGAHVWCEKPPTLSLADYDAITAVEHDGGPYVSYVFQHRFGSGAARLREQIASGELGRPLVAVCHTLWYRGHSYFDLPWRGRWATEGGGPTMGHGIHQFDLALNLLGDWDEVRAMMGTLDRDVETEDVSMAMVRLESGAMMSVVNSLLSPRETSYLRFDFTDATVELSHLYGYDDTSWVWTPAKHVAEETVATWAPTANVASSHAVQLRALLDAMDAGERPPSSGADGRRSLELVAGLYASAITGRPVARTELTPDNPFYHSMSGEPASRTAAVGA